MRRGTNQSVPSAVKQLKQLLRISVFLSVSLVESFGVLHQKLNVGLKVTQVIVLVSFQLLLNFDEINWIGHNLKLKKILGSVVRWKSFGWVEDLLKENPNT